MEGLVGNLTLIVSTASPQLGSISEPQKVSLDGLMCYNTVYRASYFHW